MCIIVVFSGEGDCDGASDQSGLHQEQSADYDVAGARLLLSH